MGIAFLEHPQRYPTIGYYGDIRRLTLSKIKDYYSKYYIPNNAVVVLIGDIDVNKAKSLAEKYFGRWKKGSYIPSPWSGETVIKGERSITIRHDGSPLLMIGYRMPPEPDYTPSLPLSAQNSRDAHIFEVLSVILGYGKSSRLYKRLVVENKLATDVSTSVGDPGPRGPGLFTIQVSPNEDASFEDIKRVIDEEIEVLKTEAVRDDELKRVKIGWKAWTLYNWDDDNVLAESLCVAFINTGDVMYDKKKMEFIQTVTKEDIMRVAREYLIRDQRVIGYLIKDKGK